MTKRVCYADALAVLGAQVDAAGGTDVLVQELADGFVLLYVTAAAQEVACVSWDDLPMLAGPCPALSENPDGARRQGPPLSPQRVNLQAVGRYVDARQGGDITVQAGSSGYHVAYAVPLAHGAAADTARVTVTLSDAELPAASPTAPPRGLRA